ncbi:hypothetical protein COBT_001130, partial [Conglomerata obtusa]
MQNHIVNPFVFKSNEFIMLLQGETSIDRPVFRKHFLAVIKNAKIETSKESLIEVEKSSNESICIEELNNEVKKSTLSNIDSSSEISNGLRCEQDYETNLVVNK